MISLATVFLCFYSQQLDVAKEKLFTQWTTQSAIPNVSFGLPRISETDDVAEQIESIRREIISATAGDLSATQREVDVPFMLGMLDGISMEHVPSFAQSCLDHLSVFDDDLGGIASSRLWRMRHRAAVILGNEEEAVLAKNMFWSLPYKSPADIVVLTLFDIRQAFEEGDVVQARELYDNQASHLVSTKTQHLRAPFAHAYARLAPTHDEALHGWFTLAEWLTEYGYDQAVVDGELVRWMNRLKNPPEMSESSDDPRLSSLATRQNIERTLLVNSEVALKKLMVLARDGDGRAAERVLEQGVSKYSTEAITLLFAFPKGVHASLDYWRLYAARIDYENKDMEQALERLIPVSTREGEYQSRARDFIDTIRGTQYITLKSAFGITLRNELPVKLTEAYPPHVIQDLLGQCIQLCHTEHASAWNTSALLVLLEHSKDVATSELAEGYRLLGECDKAIPLFKKAIELGGDSVQTTAGLADCIRDRLAMKRVVVSTSPKGASSYWHWLSNLRLLQWFVDDGGNVDEAIAKINRLRKKDTSLGGAYFISQFNSVVD